MSAPENVPMTDLMIRAEAKLERRAAALSIFQPKVLGETSAGFKPEIDQIAIQFFQKFEKVRYEIMSADHLKSIELARGCCSVEEFFRYLWPTIGGNLDTYDAAQEIINEIIMARAARKAVRWVEQSGILQEVLYA
jgi:hypothetical protein